MPVNFVNRVGGGEFNTDPGFTNPVVISGVVVTPSGTQCVIVWTTAPAASTQLKWGLAPNMDQVTAETDTNPLATSHSVTLTGLKAHSPYLFQIISRQDSGKDGMNNTVLDGYQATYQGSFGSV